MNRLSKAIADNLKPVKRRDQEREDRAADRVGRIVDSWYIAIMKASQIRVGLHEIVHNINRRFHGDLIDVYVAELERLAHSGHDEAVDAILEAMTYDELGRLVRSYHTPALTEAANRPEIPELPKKFAKWVLPSLDTAAIAALTKEQIKKLLKQIIFAPMTKKTVQRLLFTQQAMNRIAPITRLVTPQRLISVLSLAQSQGKTRAEIASQVLTPLFHTTKSDARRVARTAGALIANESNMLAFQGLGTLLVGYQCHCVNSPSSRPWHWAKRNNVVYYINPKEGQKGLAQMPKPPYEPSDPNERPAGTPFLAYYCRCYLSPSVRA